VPNHKSKIGGQGWRGRRRRVAMRLGVSGTTEIMSRPEASSTGVIT
jgi:hypothetical protein